MTQEAAPKLMRVGELAKAVGKTVRALHLYEELELLEPAARTEGGFRLYGPEAVDRIHWLGKLQAIGFSLTEIQGFVRDFHDAENGKAATSQVRAVFQERLQSARAQIAELRGIERDLLDAVAYLDSCQTCSTGEKPHECAACNQHHHGRSDAPNLFVGLSRSRHDHTNLVQSNLAEAAKEAHVAKS